MIVIDPGFVSSTYQLYFAVHRRHGEGLHIDSIPGKAIVKHQLKYESHKYYKYN